MHAVTLDFPIHSWAVQRLHGGRGDGPLVVRTDHVQEHLVALCAVSPWSPWLRGLLVLCGGWSVWGGTDYIKAALCHLSTATFYLKRGQVCFIYGSIISTSTHQTNVLKFLFEVHYCPLPIYLMLFDIIASFLSQRPTYMHILLACHLALGCLLDA